MIPIISICIPTRNRAETLRLTLENVLSETRPLGDSVEVVVSDNASTDHTAEVLHSFSPEIRSRIRTKNIGFFGNMVGLATKMARGHFIWALGDDDLILRGGVSRVLAAVKDNPAIEVFYLNYGWIPIPERNRLILDGDSQLHPKIEECHLLVEASTTLSRLEDLALLPSRNAAGLFCAMFSWLLPKQFFKSFGGGLTSKLWDCFSADVDDIYPHAKILMKAYQGRPVHLVAQPALMQGTGEWEFNQWAVAFKIVPLLKLLDYFESLNLHQEAMAKMREDFEATAGRNFARMLLHPDENQGLEVVLADAFPRLASRPLFWNRFFQLFRAQEVLGAEARLDGLLESYRHDLQARLPMPPSPKASKGESLRERLEALACRVTREDA